MTSSSASRATTRGGLTESTREGCQPDKQGSNNERTNTPPHRAALTRPACYFVIGYYVAIHNDLARWIWKRLGIERKAPPPSA